jgi:spore coat protein U-like protein
MLHVRPFAGIALLSAVVLLGAAESGNTTVCTLAFGMRGWSTHFEQAQGRGTITCDNGQTATVEILGRGASLRDGAGAFASGGEATFSAVLDISAVLGSYQLPATAKIGNGKKMGVGAAMTNGQATLTFPLTGPAAVFPATFGRIGIFAHPLNY